jgi:hypothetical protein
VKVKTRNKFTFIVPVNNNWRVIFFRIKENRKIREDYEKERGQGTKYIERRIGLKT